ncbi:twin-arginine translocase TatA/TatE family subunit [Massilia sp. TS11]|uniref:twin-arginine translocase TatA/TatE family subunit n=1 Tax=Massilia sp. TS11 TaxID=2908003 RepID=UPI001EDB9634|nr:twin-arginine translocase TatA/TatE family subunit [Massilia sp. TS11]MCG2585100.1 twin-arginine translocase TatA/TatE family subunit [Massilia sp. TS11]
MGSMSIWHWLIVLVVIVLLFGKKLPDLGGDLAKSIKGFKEGMKTDDEKAAETKKAIDVDAKEKH